MSASLAAGQVAPLSEARSIATTLAPRSVSERTLALSRHYVDTVVAVPDSAMVAAMRWLWTECNQLVEPAGVAVIAAVLSGTVDISSAAWPVALICGGNASVDSVFTIYQAADITMQQG